jgi:four helix bundle protein
VIIYDWTVIFCDKWINSFKLNEQMTGAARSGKQNIVEGSDGMATSLKTVIKLSGVAKHSLEELLNDYEDFLRQRGLRQWTKGERMTEESRKRIAKFVNELAKLENEAAAVRKIKTIPFTKIQPWSPISGLRSATRPPTCFANRSKP